LAHLRTFGISFVQQLYNKMPEQTVFGRVQKPSGEARRLTFWPVPDDFMASVAPANSRQRSRLEMIFAGHRSNYHWPFFVPVP
jgi:hypothetical protein